MSKSRTTAIERVLVAKLVRSSRFGLLPRHCLPLQEFGRLACRDQCFAFSTSVGHRHVLQGLELLDQSLFRCDIFFHPEPSVRIIASNLPQPPRLSKASDFE